MADDFEPAEPGESYDDALDRIVGPDAGGEPVQEISAAPDSGVPTSSGEEPALPSTPERREQPAGLKEYGEWRERAKAVGVPLQGTKAEIQAAVESAEKDLSGLRDAFKAWNIPEDHYRDVPLPELRRMQRVNDLLFQQQQRHREEAVRRAVEAERHQFNAWYQQQQQSPPQQQQQPAPALNLDQLREDYGEDSEIYQAAMETQRQIDGYRNANLGWTEWHQQQQQTVSQQTVAEQQQVESRLFAAIADKMVERGLGEKLSAWRPGQPYPPKQLVDWLVQMRPYYPTLPVETLLDHGLESVFGPDLARQKQPALHAARAQQARQGLGGPSTSRPAPQKDLGPGEWDEMEDPELLAAWERAKERSVA
jgi:hypothetical protein